MMWYNMCQYPILSNWGIIYEWIYLRIPKAYFPLKRCLKRAISSWEGKICAITGASEGLGAVIALHLAQVGVTCHETTCLGTQKMGSVPGNLGKIVAQNPVFDHHLSPFSWPFFWVYSTPFAIWASGECLRFQEEALLHMFFAISWASTVGPLPALSRRKMGTLNSLFYFCRVCVCMCFIALVCRCIGRHCLWFPLTFLMS